MESFGLFNFLKSALFSAPEGAAGPAPAEKEQEEPLRSAPPPRETPPARNPCLDLLGRHDRLSKSIDASSRPKK